MSENDEQLKKLKSGGTEAVAELFSEYREKLEHMIGFRMDSRLRGRIDASDVLQEAYLKVAERVDSYLEKPDVSFYVWMRQLTYQTLIDQHRLHFRSKRGLGQEVSKKKSYNATTYSIVGHLIGANTTPGRAVEREEEKEQLHMALDSMEDIDREILALRHFEGLPNKQVAEILGIAITAASNRYVRAMTRLGQIMQKLNQDE
ncbi:MAG: RNA polymerase sigma factor [Planctomycetaceae bacterium]